MSYRIGDTAFLSQGQPVTVAGRDPATGNTVLDRSQEEVRKQTRHGVLNGIAPEKREELLGMLDDIKKNPEPEKRIEELQKKIDELKIDPRNYQFVRYLEAEQGHMMNLSGYKPRFYNTDEHKLR
jgi:ATP-dependent protease HslVU (ClpYQ) peptidase subunit